MTQLDDSGLVIREDDDPPADEGYLPESDDELEEVSGPPASRSAAIADREPLPKFRRLADVLETPEIDWLVEDLLLAGELGLIAGRGGQMKSTVLLAIVASLATGGVLFGKFIVPGDHVVGIVSGEDPEGVIRNRLEAICRGHRYDLDLLYERVHVLALAGVDLADRQWPAHLVEQCQELGITVLVFDPLAELSSWAENDPDDRRRLVRTLRAIGGEAGATVLALHHFKKATDAADKNDLMRGGSALPHASRQSYSIELSADGEIMVECLKFSRAAKRDSFVLRPDVEVDPANEAVWTRARFEYVSAAAAKLDRSETFVLEQLGNGARVTTTDLKAAAQGTGISGQDIARALRVLGMRRLIGFEAGPRGAKLWFDLAGKVGKVENDLARQGGTLPGQGQNGHLTLPAPFRGQGKVEPSADLWQGRREYEADERAGMTE